MYGLLPTYEHSGMFFIGENREVLIKVNFSQIKIELPMLKINCIINKLQDSGVQKRDKRRN